MRKKYVSPELELLRFKLTGDVLRDSVTEATEHIVYDDPDPDDPFGPEWE